MTSPHPGGRARRALCLLVLALLLCATSTVQASSAGATRAPVGAAETGTLAPIPEVRGHELINRVTGARLQLVGVDATGTEDACVQGKNFGWGPMNSTEASDIAAWHVTVVRVPLNEDCWLGINHSPARFSGARYRAAIETWVGDLNAAGLDVIIDLHWSAPRHILATEEWPLPDQSHSVRFWKSVATEFRADPHAIFDLFNEPYLGKGRPTAADWACWRNGCYRRLPLCDMKMNVGGTRSQRCSTVWYRSAGMQELVTAIRAEGAKQPLMVGGLNWAGDPCGIRDLHGNGGSCMWLADEPSDPDHQLIASFHNYNWIACNTEACWDSSVAKVAATVPVITGEIGEKNCSTRYIARYMNWANERDISYLAWAWQPNSPPGCGPSNTHLLSNWNGTPSTVSPAGAFIAKRFSFLWRKTRR